MVEIDIGAIIDPIGLLNVSLYNESIVTNKRASAMVHPNLKNTITDPY